MTKTITLPLLAALLSITLTTSHAQEQDTDLNNIELDGEITDEQIRDYMKQREEYQDDPAALEIMDRIQEAAGITEADIARAQGREPRSDADADDAAAGATAAASAGESATASAEQQEPAIEGNSSIAEQAYRDRDYETALKHYEALAAEGDAYANLMLGLMYQQGQGVDADMSRAHAYYDRAADYGDDRGSELIETIEHTMSEGQRRRADDYYSQIIEEQKQAGAPDTPEREESEKYPAVINEGGRPAAP